MGWGKFDDAYPHHPKLLEVGPEGLALDVAAVCYANRYGTDGWVPDTMLSALYPPVRRPAKVADRLVEVGRWERAEGGWWIHDFADYNPTAAEAAERKAKRAAAGRKGGRRSRPPSKRSSETEANASVGASDTGEANGNPDPTPTPKAKPSSDAASGADPVEAFGQTAVDLTRHLATRVQANGHKVPGKGSATAWRWFEAIERLLRIDGADPAEVRRVVDWCTDDDFWRANIQSAGKFREKFSSLRLRMLNDSPVAHEPVYGDDPAADGSVRGLM